MMVLKCKNCGGNVEVMQNGAIGMCESCGCTMTLPKIDDEHRAEMFNRGNHFRRQGEFDKALAVYEQIVFGDNSDAEAHWCCTLCRFGIEYVEDPETLEWIPTCHRASYDNILQDIDYLAAIENSQGIIKKHYQREARRIFEVQKSILATSNNEDPFDIFICYKESEEDGTRTRDSVIAQDIYYQLTDKGHRVFFARITLEDKAGTEYEPYIFSALNSAKVMVVVGTSAEHLESVWVKNEWSRYLSLMRKDRTKLMIPCYKDMDPYDLPEALSILQSYDMNKIGFIQDLLHGIEKVTSYAEEKQSPVQAETTVQVSVENQIEPLIQRIHIFLDGKEWTKADEYCEKVLDLKPDCAEVYFLKILVDEKTRNMEELLAGKNTGFRTNKNYNRLLQFDKDREISRKLQEHIKKIDELEIKRRQEAEAEQRRVESEILNEKNKYNALEHQIKLLAAKLEASLKYQDLKNSCARQFEKFDDKLEEKYEKIKGPFSGKQKEKIQSEIIELEETIAIERPFIEQYQKDLASYHNIVGEEINEQLITGIQQNIDDLMTELKEAETSYRRVLSKYNRPVPPNVVAGPYNRFLNKLEKRSSLKLLKNNLANYDIPLKVRNIVDSYCKMELYSSNQMKECIAALKKIKDDYTVYIYNWDSVEV